MKPNLSGDQCKLCGMPAVNKDKLAQHYVVCHISEKSQAKHGLSVLDPQFDRLLGNVSANAEGRVFEFPAKKGPPTRHMDIYNFVKQILAETDLGENEERLREFVSTSMLQQDPPKQKTKKEQVVPLSLLQSKPNTSSKVMAELGLSEAKQADHMFLEVFNYNAKCVVDKLSYIDFKKNFEISDLLPNDSFLMEPSTDNTSSKKKERPQDEIVHDQHTDIQAKKNLAASGEFDQVIGNEDREQKAHRRRPVKTAGPSPERFKSLNLQGEGTPKVKELNHEAFLGKREVTSQSNFHDLNTESPRKILFMLNKKPSYKSTKTSPKKEAAIEQIKANNLQEKQNGITKPRENKEKEPKESKGQHNGHSKKHEKNGKANTSNGVAAPKVEKYYPNVPQPITSQKSTPKATPSPMPKTIEPVPLVFTRQAIPQKPKIKESCELRTEIDGPPANLDRPFPFQHTTRIRNM